MFYGWLDNARYYGERLFDWIVYAIGTLLNWIWYYGTPVVLFLFGLAVAIKESFFVLLSGLVIIIGVLTFASGVMIMARTTVPGGGTGGFGILCGGLGFTGIGCAILWIALDTKRTIRNRRGRR